MFQKTMLVLALAAVSAFGQAPPPGGGRGFSGGGRGAIRCGDQSKNPLCNVSATHGQVPGVRNPPITADRIVALA